MTDDELKNLFAGLREENTAIRQENAAAHAETRGQFETASAEMRRHFDVIAGRLESKIEAVVAAQQINSR